MKREQFIEVHDIKYYKYDIKNMSRDDLHMFVSFLETQRELEWVQKHCNESYQYIVNRLFI